MKHIYWKGVKRKIDKFIERIIPKPRNCLSVSAYQDCEVPFQALYHRGCYIHSRRWLVFPGG